MTIKSALDRSRVESLSRRYFTVFSSITHDMSQLIFQGRNRFRDSHEGDTSFQEKEQYTGELRQSCRIPATPAYTLATSFQRKPR